jgi:hypothetical protein
MTDPLNDYRIMVQEARKDRKNAKAFRVSVCRFWWNEYKFAILHLNKTMEAAASVRSIFGDSGIHASPMLDAAEDAISESKKNLETTRNKARDDVEAADKKVRAAKKALALLRRPVLEFEANIEEKEQQFWAKIEEQKQLFLAKIEEQKLQLGRQFDKQRSQFEQECVEHKTRFNKQLKELVSTVAAISAAAKI